MKAEAMKQTKYPPLPYSQLVWDMMQTDKEVYTFRSRARIEKTAGRGERIIEALRTAILNHPAFSMRVDEQGMQYYERLNDPLHGQFHDVDIEEKEYRIELTLTLNRILGDGISTMVVIEDFIRAYYGLPLEEDRYLEYLEQIEQNKQTERYLANKQWLEARFDILKVPVHPATDFPLTTSADWEEGLLTDDWSEYTDRLDNLQHSTLLPLTAIISLAAAMAIMDYNNTTEAALTWAYDGRETPMTEHIVGSLHRDIPFAISRNTTTTAQNDKEELSNLIKQASKEFRQGIAHSIYPYTLTPPHTEIWNYAVNVLEQTRPQQFVEHMPFEILTTDMQPNNKAYALLDIEIYSAPQLTIAYRYSATHYKLESIQHFAGLVKKNLLKLIYKNS